MANGSLTEQARSSDIIARFHGFARNGNSSGLSSCLAAGAPIDARNEEGRTALLIAADFNRSDAVNVLLSAGANVDAQGDDGMTALMLALCNGRQDIADALLDGGADVTLHNKEGKTCAHLMPWGAWVSGGPSGPFVEKLVQLGLDINVTDEAGETPLVGATCYGSVELLEQMIALGARIDCRDRGGDTLLHWATEQPEKAAFYLKRGIDPCALNFRRQTPLHIAQHPTVVDMLIAAGASLAGKDNQGRSPLLCSLDNLYWSKGRWTFNGHKVAAEEVISAFLLNGADPDMPAKNGRTARDAIMALCRGDTSAVDSARLVTPLPEEVTARQLAAQQKFLPLLQSHDAHLAVKRVLHGQHPPGGQP